MRDLSWLTARACLLFVVAASTTLCAAVNTLTVPAVALAACSGAAACAELALINGGCCKSASRTPVVGAVRFLLAGPWCVLLVVVWLQAAQPGKPALRPVVSLSLLAAWLACCGWVAAVAASLLLPHAKARAAQWAAWQAEVRRHRAARRVDAGVDVGELAELRMPLRAVTVGSAESGL